MDKLQREAYLAGYSCGNKTPDSSNCHFKYFETQELTNAWTQGKKQGETDKQFTIKPETYEQRKQKFLEQCGSR